MHVDVDGMGWLGLNHAKEWINFKMDWLSFTAETSQRPLFFVTGDNEE